MDDSARARAYKQAIDFVQDLRNSGYAPGQAADRIARSFPVEHDSLRGGTIGKDAVQNQFMRDAASMLDKAMGPDGKISPQYDDALKAVKDGKSVMGKGLPAWKQLEHSIESISEKFTRVAGELSHSPAARLAGSLAKTFTKVATVGIGVGVGLANAATADTPEQRAEGFKYAGREAVSGLPGVSSIAHKAMGMQGLSPIEQDIKDALTIASNGELPKNRNQKDLSITREQKFLMSDQHPGQLGALTMKGPDGKSLDVEAMLKNPAQRGQVMAEIDRRAATASPQGKELFKEMKEAAQEFATLEDRRRELAPAAPQPAQPQPVVTVARPQSFAPA